MLLLHLALCFLGPVAAIRGPDPFATVEEVQTVIVGAGVAGIAAGAKLLENGVHDFVILEAQSHYGGRVKTVKFGNEYVDLGAQWVHGEVGNVVFNMANPNNLIEKDLYDRVYIEPSGNIIDRGEADELTQMLEDIEDSSYTDLLNYTRSIGDYFNAEYPKKLAKSHLRDSPVAAEIKDWFAKDLNVDDSSDSWFETSGHGYAVYEVLDGHQEWGWISGGYYTVLELLMKKFNLSDKIRLLCEVVQIVWDDLHPDLNNKVLVKCSNGATFVADHVLVTVSLGVLKANAEKMFKPALPAQKVNSIEGLGFGTVDKIILEFPYKWWTNSSIEYALVWEPNDVCKMKILNKNKVDLDTCWDHFVYAFNDMHNQPNVLCGWIYGAAARYMEELSEFEVRNKTMALLQQFVGRSLDATVPYPTYFLRSSWWADPYFQGSYSFRSMETEARGAEASHLAEPILNSNGKLVLLFAGEATHSTHYSTVHGAIETGWREAERIMKL